MRLRIIIIPRRTKQLKYELEINNQVKDFTKQFSSEIKNKYENYSNDIASNNFITRSEVEFNLKSKMIRNNKQYYEIE